MLASTLDEYSWLLFYPFSPLLPSFRLMQPDGGSLEPDATADGCCCMKIADDQEQFRRSQAGGLAFSIVEVFVLAFLRQT